MYKPDYDLQERVKTYLSENGIMKKHFAKQIGELPAMLSHWLAKRGTFLNETMDKIKEIISS